MTRTAPKQSKTPFPSAPLPWGWNFLPPGGTPTRERCQSVGIEKEREQAVALVAAYREQEAISEANDIDGMSNSFDKLTRFSRNAAGGVEGEMMRRRMSKADPEKYNEAQTKLAELRQEAMDLIAPVLRRVLVSYFEELAQAAIEAEARLEAIGLPLRNGNSWTLHENCICRALLSCKVKVEKALLSFSRLAQSERASFALHPEVSIFCTRSHILDAF
jgi:hypothetical protein